jgi:uncharacterized RmlC-like cupin family protein
MTYAGAAGEPSARATTDVPGLVMNPSTGASVAFLAPGSATGGSFGLFRWELPVAPGGAGLHFHRGFSESFYILSGTVTFETGRGASALDAGSFLFVPPGGLHGFRNDSSEPASMLILFAPGVARERYFEELAAIRAEGRELSDDEWSDLYARHDQVNIAQPG